MKDKNDFQEVCNVLSEGLIKFHNFYRSKLLRCMEICVSRFCFIAFLILKSEMEKFSNVLMTSAKLNVAIYYLS